MNFSDFKEKKETKFVHVLGQRPTFGQCRVMFAVSHADSGETMKYDRGTSSWIKRIYVFEILLFARPQ